MKNLALGFAIAAALSLPQAAFARDETAIGVGTGAVAGALVAGPIGAVVGGIVGGVVGSNSEQARRPRRVRRHRVRAAGSTPARRDQARAASVRVAEKTPPAPRITPSSEPAQPATTWTDPH